MKKIYDSFSHQIITNNHTLIDLMEYDGLDYWWYNDINIYNSILNRNKNILFFMKIHFYLTKYFSPILCVVDALLSLSLRILKLIFSKIQSPAGKKIGLFKTSAQRWILKRGADTKDTEVSGVYYDEIFDASKDNIYPVNVFTDIPSPFSIKRYLSVIKYYPYNTVGLTKYWSFNVWKEEKKAMKYFNGVYTILKQNPEWLDALSHETGLAKGNLNKILEYHIRCTTPFCTRHYYLLDRMISIEEPDVLVLTGEQAYMGRGWIYLGQKYQIPCIGLQHGVIHTDDIGYSMHSLSDMANDAHHSFPIPDLTLVWGKRDYDLLVNKFGYPEEQVVITGNPRNDRIVKISCKDMKQKIMEQFHIDNQKRIVLWATQSHVNPLSENERYFSEVFSALSSIENIVLIIKPHPAEGEIASELFNKFADIYNVQGRAYLMNKNVDTIELVAASDLLILKDSTVGQDGIALKKPLVVLDFGENFDKGNYVKEKVAVGISSSGKLADVILTLLGDTTMFIQKREEYIEKYMYKLDGLAAQRCSDIIISLANKKKNTM